MGEIQEKKSWLQNIPGFRSGSAWKMLLAGWLYAIVITYILVTLIG